MMAYFRTCRHCLLERKPCERREAVRASIRGMGLTSVAFRCATKAPLFRPGQRVAVAWPVYPDDWSYEDGYSLESWPATVIQKTEKGFVIKVDDVPSDHETPAREYIKNDHLFCNVRPSRLTALDEPDRAVCSFCNNPEITPGKVDGCGAYNDGYEEWRPSGCLNVEPRPSAHRSAPKSESEALFPWEQAVISGD